ncbi:MAG: CapA family protein, partial [Pseudomonadota bacterium]
GIEIYNGQPIFYSLGDFMFQNETLDRLPSDNYEAFDLGEQHHVADFNDRRYENETKGFPAVAEVWEAVIAVPKFRNRELVEVALYPIDLAFGEPVQVRGRPLLANDELGEKILDYLQERSEPYGTRIDIRRGVGYVELD